MEDKTDKVQELIKLNNRIQELNREVETLKSEKKALEIRLLDAEGRRSDSYDFARKLSIETSAWQHRYENLKRDLEKALFQPLGDTRAISVENRGHAIVVRAISEQFPGIAATHYLEREEILLGVDALRAQVERGRLKQRIAAIIKRITRPLRSIAAFLRQPFKVLSGLREYATQHGFYNTLGLLIRKLTGLGKEK